METINRRRLNMRTITVLVLEVALNVAESLDNVHWCNVLVNKIEAIEVVNR